MNSKSKWALVTGASGGIGAEFARILARKGYQLVLVSRNEEKLKALLESLGGCGVVIPADLSRTGEPARVVAECDARGYAIDLLVNNAGAGLFGEALDLDVEAVEGMMQLNMQSLTALCTLFGRKMKERGQGNILNVGSMAGNQPTPFFASYAASKAYVLSFSLALRQELKPWGVRVTCVQPGYVRTAFDDNSGIESPKYKDFSQKNSLPPETVARIGIRMMERNRPFGLAGFGNKVAGFFTRLLPQSLKPVILYSAVSKLSK